VQQFDIPETPWDLIAAQHNAMRTLWNGDYSLYTPALWLDFPWSFELEGTTYQDFYCFIETRRRAAVMTEASREFRAPERKYG
jgi:hypothetical protein